MPSYLILWNWTEGGVKNFRESTKRVEQVKADFEELGVSLDVRWLLGAYDGMGIAEAPDEESLSAALLRLGSSGNVRTTTMRAVDAAEMGRIIGRAGS